jgi:hypothetical protein
LKSSRFPRHKSEKKCFPLEFGENLLKICENSWIELGSGWNEWLPLERNEDKDFSRLMFLLFHFLSFNDGRSFVDEKLLLWKKTFKPRFWLFFFFFFLLLLLLLLFRFADFQRGQAIRICVEKLFSLWSRRFRFL